MTQRVALITGGSRGIGAEIAKTFRSTGLRVIAPSRQELDLENSESINRYLDSLTTPIDILVNNAGINILGGSEEFGPDDFTAVLQINLVAPMQLIGKVVTGMKARKFGRILNISSIWSIVSKERRVTYSASKAAINGMTRSLAIELGPYGIMVNALAPGYVDTELTRQNNSAAQLEEITKAIPLGRLAQADELARYARFLCSDENSYMTGQILVVDGGFVCK